MEKKPLELSRFEYDGSYNESKIGQKAEQNSQNSYSNKNNPKGSISFTKKAGKKTPPFNWIRIRSFFIRHKGFKRSMEFSCHPGGVHLLRMAMLYSEGGCKMCKVYVERNLF